MNWMTLYDAEKDCRVNCNLFGGYVLAVFIIL